MTNVHLSLRAECLDPRQDRGQCHLHVLPHGQALPSVVFHVCHRQEGQLTSTWSRIVTETTRSDRLGYSFATCNQEGKSAKSIFSEQSSLS